MCINWEAISAIATAVAAGAALWTTRTAARSSNQARLREQLQAYLDNYLLLVRDDIDPLSIRDFELLSRRDKRHVEILGGLFVGVLDLMFASKDRRSKRWSGFLVSFSSLLLSEHFKLEDYATHPRTLKAIAAARKTVSQDTANTKTKAPPSQ